MTTDFKTVQITGFILEEQTALSLDDVCRACAADSGRIVALVDEGLLAPEGDSLNKPPDQWNFTGAHLHRATVALRLQNDLGVNLAGAALALELLDELDSLRTRLRRLEGS
jgi:chaperone modulatory protein CbpM